MCEKYFFWKIIVFWNVTRIVLKELYQESILCVFQMLDEKKEK
jgi:hypothetical protein